MDGDSIVARARAALGARFRLHGRDPAEGLDCVGLAAWALGVTEWPRGYGLRSGDQDAVAGMIARAGLARVTERRAGDLLLCLAGPGQLHLAIWTGLGVIHADATLRRVVERPGVPPWPVAGVWRSPRHCEEQSDEAIQGVSWPPGLRRCGNAAACPERLPGQAVEGARNDECREGSGLWPHSS